ncbi:unnamed protein product [Nezara viridula]|uniref:Uncharacterized protein n=1 Tax=Nezara viridula TaxID=85310 RepID=A0A9P0HTN0_NEZVI|nr:unnamed protein product [Nezara viridula]
MGPRRISLQPSLLFILQGGISSDPFLLIEFNALKEYIQDHHCPSCLGKCDNIRIPCRSFTANATDLVKAGEFLFSKEPHQLELDPMALTCYEERVVGTFS